MLDNKSIKEFDQKLDTLTRDVITEAKKKEPWPQDSVPDVYKEIEALSDALSQHVSSGASMKDLSSELCVSAISMMEYDRALKFIDSYISSDAPLSELLTVKDGADPEIVNYTMILLNRMVLLASVKLIERIFAPSRISTIYQALESTEQN